MQPMGLSGVQCRKAWEKGVGSLPPRYMGGGGRRFCAASSRE
jgi:hypothetical protein